MRKQEIITPNIPELSLHLKQVSFRMQRSRALHFHKEAELFRIDQGQFLFHLGGEEKVLSAGECILINAFTPHELHVISETADATYLQIDLQPYIDSLSGAADDLLRFFMDSLHTAKYKIFAGDSPMSTLMADIERELTQKAPFYEMQIKVYIYQLLVNMFRFRFLIRSEQDGKVKRLMPAIDHINQNFDKPLRLEELSALVYLDKYYFCKLFKSSIGATPVEYINFLRLHHAKQRLLDSEKSISQIAADCGFASMQYFNKLFKKQHGFTPREYRKMFHSQ